INVPHGVVSRCDKEPSGRILSESLDEISARAGIHSPVGSARAERYLHSAARRHASFPFPSGGHLSPIVFGRSRRERSSLVSAGGSKIPGLVRSAGLIRLFLQRGQLSCSGRRQFTGCSSLQHHPNILHHPRPISCSVVSLRSFSFETPERVSS